MSERDRNVSKFLRLTVLGGAAGVMGACSIGGTSPEVTPQVVSRPSATSTEQPRQIATPTVTVRPTATATPEIIQAMSARLKAYLNAKFFYGDRPPLDYLNLDEFAKRINQQYDITQNKDKPIGKVALSGVRPQSQPVFLRNAVPNGTIRVYQEIKRDTEINRTVQVVFKYNGNKRIVSIWDTIETAANTFIFIPDQSTDENGNKAKYVVPVR